MFITVVIHTKDVSLFGVMMDSWQRPIVEVGLAGADGGRGGQIPGSSSQLPGRSSTWLPGSASKDLRGIFPVSPCHCGQQRVELEESDYLSPLLSP
jgi:hypothetical protein